MLKYKELFLDALEKEIALQKDYFPHPFLPYPFGIGVGGEGSQLQTIYFGGGTPSLLSGEEITRIFEQIKQRFSISPHAEITLEANPDDLTAKKIKELKNTPVNRLSIGIQSFLDEDLVFMNRAHTSEMAVNSVKTAQDLGFENISIDLIYGMPTMTNDQWKENLAAAFNLNVQHLSAYCLTVEPKTALHQNILSGKNKSLNEDVAAEHFEILLSEMKHAGFIQYEISNFCKNGFYSRHNSNYWLKDSYLGLGPSAHSFNGISRQWNVANNNAYIKSLLEKELVPYEKETLTPEQNYNEFILTSLRTIWGTDLQKMEKLFGKEKITHCLKEANKYMISEDLVLVDYTLFLSTKGKLIADRIASDLFFVN